MSKKPFDFGNLVGKKPELLKPTEPVTEGEKMQKKPEKPTVKEEESKPEKSGIQENIENSKVGRMGRPPATHKRQPFTSRCNPDTWKKIKALAMARDMEPGEIVEAAFSDYLRKNSDDLSGLSDFLKS